jgi:hypothetical protein
MTVCIYPCLICPIEPLGGAGSRGAFLHSARSAHQSCRRPRIGCSVAPEWVAVRVPGPPTRQPRRPTARCPRGRAGGADNRGASGECRRSAQPERHGMSYGWTRTARTPAPSPSPTQSTSSSPRRWWRRGCGPAVPGFFPTSSRLLPRGRTTARAAVGASAVRSGSRIGPGERQWLGKTVAVRLGAVRSECEQALVIPLTRHATGPWWLFPGLEAELRGWPSTGGGRSCRCRAATARPRAGRAGAR